MQRRQWLTQVGAATLATLAGASAAPAGKSKKKGCTGGDPNTIRKVGGHWYYTWWSGGKNDTDAEFVPMIKNLADISSEAAFDRVRAMTGITHLLGYNEPERPDQGNIPIADALKHWRRVVKLAEEKKLRLGSPAPSSDGGGMAYFHEFMAEAERRKLRIDFIALHWYRSRDPAAFGAFIDEIANRYKKPVWITEFNGWNGDEAENYKFLKGALSYLERSENVERYSYFEPGGGALSLFKPDGSLSRLGELYRDAGT